jgi:hypothetical protein
MGSDTSLLGTDDAKALTHVCINEGRHTWLGIDDVKAIPFVNKLGLL